MRRRRRAGFDVDGLLGSYIDAALPGINLFTGKTYVHDDITGMRIDQCLNFTDEQKQLYFEMVEAEGFCASIKPYPDAVETIRALRQLPDVEVFAVTMPFTRVKTWTYERTAWLREHFDFADHEIVHTAAKHLVDVDILVEDSHKALMEWSSSYPDRLAILLNRRYNRDIHCPGVLRVDSLREARAAIIGHLSDLASSGRR